MSGVYTVLIGKEAARGLAAIQPREQAQRLADRIRTLADEPRPHGCEKLRSGGGQLRIRQGDWRAIYEVEDGRKLVTVLAVRKRNERTY